jgi:DNA-binding PadR family transcriptional regulator
VLEHFLAAPSRWVHGYTLLTELQLQSGTLYPILMRLAELGWLETAWEHSGQPGRPPRHLYRLARGAGPEVRALLRQWRTRELPPLKPRPAT